MKEISLKELVQEYGENAKITLSDVFNHDEKKSYWVVCINGNPTSIRVLK